MSSAHPQNGNADASATRADWLCARWWRALFDQSDDAQFVCARDGSVLELNRRAQSLVGPRGSEMPSAALLTEMLTPSTYRKVMDVLSTPEAHGSTLCGVSLTIDSDLPLIADLVILSLEGGCSLLTAKDASRRWRMETHAQRLITAIDSTPDAVYLTDAKFRLTFVNAAFQALTGYSIEEILGQGIEVLRAELERSRIQESLHSVKDGKSWCGECSNRSAEGKHYPVEVTLAPIFDRRGVFIGAVGLERDISQRKQLQDELLLERNLVRSVIDSLESAVYAVDRRYRLTHFNDAWTKLPKEQGWLLFEAAPKVGRPILDYASTAQHRVELQTAFECVMSIGQPQEVRSTDSNRHHWQANIVPWRHKGECLGLVLKISDITQSVCLQSQLYQAQKMETIGALAAGVAHDFNNLILAIRGNTSLLLMGEIPEEDVAPRLRQIDEAAMRAAEITHQLLAFSRASDEQVSVLDFNQVIKDAGHLATRTLRGKSVIRLEPAADPVKVQMDSTRAQQLILNLCVNAYDAMPDGGQITITNSVVRLTRSQSTKGLGAVDYCRCSVADTGTGIPPQILARIFDPFFTTKEKGKGTGLGLSICQSIVTKIGGFIEVESRIGQGTTFQIFLPIADKDLTNSVNRAAPSLNKGCGRILVVDDLDLVLEFTSSFLEKAGYEVVTANGPRAALQRIEEASAPFDLMFTDFNMPDMSGWQLIQHVSVDFPEMKAILASGYLDEEERLQIEQCKGVRILDKPYGINEATETVSQMLSEKRQGL